MKKYHQAGVAVVTALLLTTLAITIVASLFWQQQVQVRSIENQRFQLQKKWILRGALDWARLILREDLRTSQGVDHLGEPWAVTLGETHLDQYVENGKSDTDDSEASLSGQITDAQSRFNLNNLSVAGVPNAKEIAMFSRLLANLRMDGSLAKKVAAMIASTQSASDPVGVAVGGSGEKPASGAVVASDATPASATGATGVSGDAAKSASVVANPEVQFLRFSQIDDLLAVPGFAPEMALRLKDFVAVLPYKSKINLNTTSKEVLAARLNISPTDAALIIAARERAYFRDLTDFEHRFPAKIDAYKDEVSVSTDYFFVNGKVKLSRSALEVNALLQRTQIATKVLWVREN